MKNNILLCLFATCLCFTAQAQQKKLSQAQAMGTQLSLTKPMNMVSGWSDDTHYIEFDTKDRKQYAVHIQTGERTPYTPPPKSDVNVMIKDKDVYIQYGKEEAKRLTNNPDEELN